jgi:hypothetical protein
VTDRRALVVTTPAAAARRTSGATLRADEVVALLQSTGHTVLRTTPQELRNLTCDADLAVAVSYACACALPDLRARAPRLWLDAVDSWLLVNGSGLLRGRPSYALRAARDAWRIARMGRPDLVTYISGADLRQDRGTISGSRLLVLPGQSPAVTAAAEGTERRLVIAGDWSYPPNRDGLRWFLRRVLPELEQLAPADAWHVAVYGDAAVVLDTERVRYVGYVADAGELYREGDVHAAPVQFGGGVKRKVLSPLLAGLPVVTTPAGAHGLRAHPLLDVQRGPRGFAAAVARRLCHDASASSPVSAHEVLDQDDSALVTAWLRA